MQRERERKKGLHWPGASEKQWVFPRHLFCISHWGDSREEQHVKMSEQLGA